MGTWPYLIAAAAADGKLQLYAILRNTPTSPVSVSMQMDLATPGGCAQAVIAIVNLHRLLHGVQACLPAQLAPLQG